MGIGRGYIERMDGRTHVRTDFEPEEEEVGLVVPAQKVEEVGHPGGVCGVGAPGWCIYIYIYMCVDMVETAE